MGIGKAFTMALSSILNSKVRSFLTMLGIIIGIAAVIILVSLMNGLTSYVTSTFQEMGTTTITVGIKSRATTKTVKPAEMFKYVEDNPTLLNYASPNVTLSGKLKTAETTSDNTITANCTGVSEQYYDIKKMTIAFGRFIGYEDCENSEKVCVLGTYEAIYFFNSASGALNQTIKINGEPYTIVGVLEQSEDSTQSSGDDLVYLPYSTAAKANGSATISSYTVAAVDEDHVTEAVTALKSFMNEKIGDSDYYTVTSMLSMIEKMTSMLNKMKIMLVAIAAISLLVGGIGIMNIMLVSVSERTREIGIRKSLGATRKNIMMQFVIEAGTVSCIGGIFGIILGAGVSVLTGKMMSFSISPSGSAIVMAFCVSVGIGIVFGFLPARKAARLNPIDALRYE